MALFTRQPFAELGSPRLQALSSAKNRQNAIAQSFSSPLKQTQSAPSKRRASDTFADDDSENIDPASFVTSPSKKSKTSDGFSKPSQFSLVASPPRPSPAVVPSHSLVSPSKPSTYPRTTSLTPISLSRGSPKHKRVGLLSKRRASSSPFRRVDPPSFSNNSPVLPFSIDAALKGSIPDYNPKASIATPNHVSAVDELMPKAWFFEIHEDTPEQEAANMMEHSASVLDISSDDDFETKMRNDELERGKENVPPPDFSPTQPNARSRMSADDMETNTKETAMEHVKLPRLKTIAQDAMDEDRSPLKDLPAAEFYGDGLDATSYVTVDATLEKPSGLSKEFDFSVPTPAIEDIKEDTLKCVKEEEPIQAPAEENGISQAPVAALEEQDPSHIALSSPSTHELATSTV